MLLQYIGDPRNGFDGPAVQDIHGFHFEKNGTAVDVAVTPDMGESRAKVVADCAKRLSRNSHFRLVTPEVLLAEAQEKAKVAMAAALKAEEIAKAAHLSAEKELQALTGRADDDAEVSEEVEGVTDESDEGAVEDAGTPATRGPRRFRRS